MLSIVMLIFGCYLIFNGINAVLTGVLSATAGPTLGAASYLINYQESPLSFIFEVLVHLVIGGWLIIGAIKLMRKKE